MGDEIGDEMGDKMDREMSGRLYRSQPVYP